MENPLTVVESGCDEGIDETIQEKNQRRDMFGIQIVWLLLVDHIIGRINQHERRSSTRRPSKTFFKVYKLKNNWLYFISGLVLGWDYHHHPSLDVIGIQQSLLSRFFFFALQAERSAMACTRCRFSAPSCRPGVELMERVVLKLVVVKDPRLL